MALTSGALCSITAKKPKDAAVQRWAGTSTSASGVPPSNEENLLVQVCIAESGLQDASKIITSLYFNGVIIPCITKRKFSVYTVIEKLLQNLCVTVANQQLRQKIQ